MVEWKLKKVVGALILLALFGCEQPAPEIKSNFWQGAFTIGDQSWDVGLTFEEFCSAEISPKLTMPDIWRSDIEIENFKCQENTIQFSLPWDLGNFDGIIGRDGISGEISRDDGGKAPLILKPNHRPDISYQDFSIEREGIKVAATLVLPAGDGPFPAVVILHGGGDSSRAAEPYRFWADYLARQGIAVVIYDKRGNGQSGSNWREIGFEPRARDVALFVETLAARNDIRVDSIGLLGVSQGGWVSVLALTFTEKISFIATISSPVVPVLEADTFALISSMRNQGFEEADINRAVVVWTAEADLIRHLDSEKSWENYRSLIAKAETEGWYQKYGYEPLVSESWFGMWYAQVLDFDPGPILAQSQTPMLWLYGANDTQSEVGKNVQVLEAFDRDQNKDFQFKIYPGVGHGMLVGSNSGDPEKTFLSSPPGFFEDLMAWLNKNTRQAE